MLKLSKLVLTMLFAGIVLSQTAPVEADTSFGYKRSEFINVDEDSTTIIEGSLNSNLVDSVLNYSLMLDSIKNQTKVNYVLLSRQNKELDTLLKTN